MNDTRRAQVAAETADVYHLYRITRLGNELRLHFIGSADEEYLGSRILRADISGNRKSRVNMAACAACGDKNSFALSILTPPLFLYFSIFALRDTLSTTPISMSNIHSDEPP